MSNVATSELFSIFNARRVKAPELRATDPFYHAITGTVRNRLPVLSRLRAAAERIGRLEPETHNLSSARFAEEVESAGALARVKKLVGPALDRAFALGREAVVRAIGKRPFDVQIMGAMAMHEGRIAEMATGEGKTLTAAVTASVWALEGRPVHVITVNDYLVARDAEQMGPIYKTMGLQVGWVVHEHDPRWRMDHYRRNIVYCTSKELVADFLRDQIHLGPRRNATQTAVNFIGTGLQRLPLLVPGLHRVIVDEADSLLIDEAVTPLIISNSPDEDANTPLYSAACALAKQLESGRDFTTDRGIRHIELTQRGHDRLEELAGDGGFWRGRRRREELVVQALVALHCYHRDEQYMISHDGKVQIIDEFTGRVLADRSWRHGLHQAVEVKEGVKITADKENLARLSFQRFFRQYPRMAGMTGTAWEARGELWQIYRLPVARIPTNKPCIREHLPLRCFDTAKQKWDAVVQRVCDLSDRGVPVLVGTRSVWASEEVSTRLAALGRRHRVLNARQDAEEAAIVAEAGQQRQITVATNMAGRGTDILLGRGVAEMGGLHVLATEPHGSHRVDRQLFGRAARQGDPGSAQMFCSAEDDLLARHVAALRRSWRSVGAARLIALAQMKAERLARFNRKQVLRSDDWMDQQVPF